MASLWTRLAHAVGLAPAAWAPPPPVEPAPDPAKMQRGTEAFARWDTALAAVREEVTSADGQWFLDALAWPVVAAARAGARDAEGPVPPPSVMAEVLSVLGSDVSAATLVELETADHGLHALRAGTWPTTDSATTARFRAQCQMHAQALSAALRAADNPAHRALREQLPPLADSLPEGYTLQTTTALSTVRWWPHRSRELTYDLARMTDPLNLASVGRSLTESRDMTKEAHDTLGQVNALSRGEGLPSVDPVRWILAALAYRVGVLDVLNLGPSPTRVVLGPDGRRRLPEQHE